MRIAHVTALSALLLAGCGNDAAVPSQVLVRIDATDVMQTRATQLRVTVRDHEDEVVLEIDSSLGTELALPATVPIVPRGGDAARRFSVTTSLLDRAGAPVLPGPRCLF